MMDCHFIREDQSLAPEGSQPEFGAQNPAMFPAWADQGTLPGSANPNKGLYCLILWLIGISSLVEPKKTFHLVSKHGKSCLLKTIPLPTP